MPILTREVKAARQRDWQSEKEYNNTPRCSAHYCPPSPSPWPHQACPSRPSAPLESPVQRFQARREHDRLVLDELFAGDEVLPHGGPQDVLDGVLGLGLRGGV